MPKGSWTPPEAGDAPQEVKDILAKVYKAYRDKHPAENEKTKTRGARIAWAAVKNAGYHKNAEGKWEKKGAPSAEHAELVDANEFVVFRTGKYPQGEYTEADLDEMVGSFNADDPPHIIVGHSSDYKGHTRIPSFGRVLGGLKRVGNELVAFGAKFSESLARWIKKGYYDRRSVEIASDPTTGKKRVVAVGMLGVAPPAVKGLPSMDEALDDIALSFAESIAEAWTIVEFAAQDGIDFENLDTLLSADTFEELSEACATFLSETEDKLHEGDYEAGELQQHVWDLQSECLRALGMHAAAIEKIDSVKEGLSEKIGKAVSEMMDRLFNKKKLEGIDMDTQKEKDYQEKIKTLEGQVKEFADQKKAADDAKAAADAVSADEKFNTEIKAFCEDLRKVGKYTKADDEAKAPESMFKMAKAGIDYKQFFNSRPPVVVMGEMDISGKMKSETEDQRPQVLKAAEVYAKAHMADVEFRELTSDQATSRALYLHANNKIKFAGE